GAVGYAWAGQSGHDHSAERSPTQDPCGHTRTRGARCSRTRLAEKGRAQEAGMTASVDRVALLRRGIALEAVTVGYNAFEGLVAIGAGVTAGSVALTVFGIDAVIEVTSGALLWWRLWAELG